jgi:nucleoside-diphosphate-sugar epimerase
VTFAVTGANGFLGVHIIHHLLQLNHKVVAICRPNASLSEFELIKKAYSYKNIDYSLLQWNECELYDTDGLMEVFCNVDFVMHVAGTISYHKRDFEKLVRVNKDYTANVVNVALHCKVKKLLYCSSIAAISKTSDSSLITEDKEWDDKIPHSNYGLSKYLGECEVWRGAEEGLPVVVINPGIILGYGDFSKGSNKLFSNAQSSFRFYSQGITGWVGVNDVADIAIKLCLSDVVKERFILTSENVSYRQVANMMCAAFGSRRPTIEVNGLLYQFVYRLMALKEGLGIGGMLSKETVQASIAQNYFDNSKIKKALNVEFESMENVVKQAIKKAQASS